MSSFDFIICGGGLAGLVLANRLSEDPRSTVCVLEAGGDVTAHPDTQIPGLLFKNGLNDEIHWKFNSVSQAGANNRLIYLARGKALGGSSMVNYMGVGRGHKEEYDAFEKLGAKGWNWDNLIEYFKKSETFTVKDSTFGIRVDERYDGQSGPWQRSPVQWISSLHEPCMKAFQDFGVPFNPQPFAGDNSGVSITCNGVHPTEAVRSSSASSYYEPVKNRPNLQVILNAQVTRIVMADEGEGKHVAEKVEYLKDGRIEQVTARKEVILSAGSHQSPQILELSGIGDKKLLESLGIPCIIDLPGVGNNLQEHFWTPHIVEVDPAYDTLDTLLFDPERAAAEYQQYLTDKTGMLTGATGASCWAFLQTEKFMDVNKLSHIALKEENEVQKAWLTSRTVPQLEILPLPGFLPSPVALMPQPGKHYLSTLVAIMHPFARGSVHISSADPLAHPSIDLSALDNPTDAIMLREGFKFTRKLFAGKEFIKAEIVPGEQVQTDEEIDEYVRETVQTVNHPVGTAAMLPRKDGGVVDNQLRVYGTENLRVVDASVFPIQISAHTQATVYAIAEKAADLIKLA